MILFTLHYIIYGSLIENRRDLNSEAFFILYISLTGIKICTATNNCLNDIESFQGMVWGVMFC